ncbi:MAG TPA: CAP domain-containing protein [Burkholderiales bacterium]|nr:CAP domain-containing protein [Burkholderiales bacterium]
MQKIIVKAALLLMLVCSSAAANGLYDAINGLRSEAGPCASAASGTERLPPLVRRSALERVAAGLAHGEKLRQSLAAAGYRATRSTAINVSGDGAGAHAAGILASRGYCRQLQNAAMTEVGIYQDARQIWIVMATPFAASVGLSEDAAGQRVLTLVNQARATARYCGNRPFDAAPPLRWNDALAKASRQHAEDMAHNNYFSHSGHDGSDPAQRVERAGYKYRSTAENIAAGQMKAVDAVADWIKSPAHCANLMNPAFTDMGVAFSVERGSEMGVYWTQEFGARR